MAGLEEDQVPPVVPVELNAVAVPMQIGLNPETVPAEDWALTVIVVVTVVVPHVPVTL
jgi:hypothetical protein